MSMKNLSTLSDRRNDLTRTLILDAAIETLEHASVSELTVRAVAKHANISERTIFRYYASREEFLDAVTMEMRSRLALPRPPTSVEELKDAARVLYQAFEARPKLIKAALHSEIFDRMRQVQGGERWAAVGQLLDALAPEAGERDRKIATANIRYYLSASTWHYYRFYFGFSLEESIACAETAIRQAIAGLGKSM
jgi:AcrR family transcriptional regulator